MGIFKKRKDPFDPEAVAETIITYYVVRYPEEYGGKPVLCLKTTDKEDAETELNESILEDSDSTFGIWEAAV